MRQGRGTRFTPVAFGVIAALVLLLLLGCPGSEVPASEAEPGSGEGPRPDAAGVKARPPFELGTGGRPLEPAPEKPGPLAFPPAQARVPQFELQLAEADLAKLNSHPTSDEKVPAVIVLDGQAAPGRLRFRGSSTRTLPQKSFKIELDPGLTLGGRDHFELLASYLDSGKLTEKFATDLYRALGVPISATQYVRVSVNGEHQGLYLDMERVGKDFLRAHGFDDQASIYRTGGRNNELKLPRAGPYQRDYTKKTNEELPFDDLDELLHVINRTDDAEFERRIAEWIDLDAYLAQLAGEALISNYLVEDEGGYWIHELPAQRWSYAPWDLNNCRMTYYRNRSPSSEPKVDASALTFTVYDPAVQSIYDNRRADDPEQRPTWSVLNTRLWDRPRFRARIVAKLEQALNELFTPEAAGAYIDGLWGAIEHELRADPHVIPEMAEAAPGFLERYVAGRRAWLRGSLDALRAHGGGDLVINELAFGEGGFVELHNRGATELELDGLTLTGDLREPHQHRLSGRLAPGAYLKVPFALPTTGGEVGVFDAGRVFGPADVVYFGPHAPGTAYARVPGEEETWSETAPTPGEANR